MPFGDSTEKGVTIRQPSTANLMIDSKDRGPLETVSNFQITRSNALLNGFFTRIGLTEMVLEWDQYNVSQFPPVNNKLTIEAVGSTSGTTTTTFTPVNGYYTAKLAIDFLLASLNTISATVVPATTWALTNPTPGRVVLTPNNPISIGITGSLAKALNIDSGLIIAPYDSNTPLVVGLGVDLRPFRFLDFVSNQLTYNQSLKDASTTPAVRDVLTRWYMDYDVPPQYDAYGFPILMGYAPIYNRRIFNPPKQIKWDPTQPIGNVSFQIYDEHGNLALTNDQTSNFLMTLQVSEV